MDFNMRIAAEHTCNISGHVISRLGGEAKNGWITANQHFWPFFG